MINLSRSIFFIAAVFATAACSAPQEKTSLIEFQANLQSLCGMVAVSYTHLTLPTILLV